MSRKHLLILSSVLTMVTSAAHATTGDASFTPSGFKIPVMKITISKNTGSAGTAFSGSDEQVLYQCSSTTEANCLLDLANQTDLDTIAAAAANVKIRTGTYDQLAVYTCADGKGGSSSTSVYIKGTFSAGASPVTYYTDATSSNQEGISSSISSASFAEITNWGCATQVVPMPSAITVSTTTSVTMNLLVDLSYLGNSTSSTSSGMGGCKVRAGGGVRGVCATFPVMTPYIGTETTSNKRFKVAWHNTSGASAVDAKANTIVIVPMAGTTPLMAYSRSFMSEDSVSNSSAGSGAVDTTYGGVAVGNATDVATFKVNSDGSVAFEIGGSADNYGGKFTSFQTTTHTGSATYKNVSGTTWYYHAVSF